MKPASRLFSLIPVALAISSLSASAAVVWDEAVKGELSKNNLAPTPVTIKLGANTFKGTITDPMKYYDYATVTVPPGHIMVSIKLDALTSPGESLSIFGLAPGKICETEPSGNKSNKLLGWVGLKVATSIGRELITGLSKPNNGGYGNSGFTPPLKAGDYTFWIQDYNTPVTYQYTVTLEKAAPPTIVVKSKKVLPNGTLSMSGAITGYGGATVSYRIGSGKLQKAKGSRTLWTIPATKLKKGKTIVTITAKGDFGTSTKKVPITVK